MTRYSLLVLFSLLAQGSCIKTALIQDKYIHLRYSQTFCADPWPTGGTDSLTSKNILHYLDSLNLYVASFELKKEFAAETCFACTCLTGNIIHITTLDSKELKEKYQKIGFK